MLTPNAIRSLLKNQNLRAVARDTGLSYMTVLRFVADTHQPMYDTVKRLSDYCQRMMRLANDD